MKKSVIVAAVAVAVSAVSGITAWLVRRKTAGIPETA